MGGRNLLGGGSEPSRSSPHPREVGPCVIFTLLASIPRIGVCLIGGFVGQNRTALVMLKNPVGMKAVRCKGGAGAFTLLELLSVTAVIIVLAALLLPALERVRAQAKRAQCVSRLRQVGVGFQNFAHDHNGLFPMALPASAGGTLEFAASGRRLSGNFYFSYHHLQALSAELVTPQLLVCPADTRLPAPSFGGLQNSNLSYFVGINASYAHPDSILAGDRNVTNDWAGAPSLVRLGGNYSLRWTHELHRFKGNLLFSDGRVEEKNTPALRVVVGQAPLVAELALPTAQPSAWRPPHGSGASVDTRPPETTSPGTASKNSPEPIPVSSITAESRPLTTAGQQVSAPTAATSGALAGSMPATDWKPPEEQPEPAVTAPDNTATLGTLLPERAIATLKSLATAAAGVLITLIVVFVAAAILKRRMSRRLAVERAIQDAARWREWLGPKV